VELQRVIERSEVTAPVVVLQASYANGLGIIRDLAAYGVPAVAVDAAPDALGFFSRHAARWRCPDPSHEEAAFVDSLEELGGRLPRKGVLFPTHDEYIWAVSRNAARLEPLFHIPFARWDVMWRLASKQEQFAAAAAAGVDTPLTRFADSVEELLDDETVPFPAILKPVDGVGFKRRFGRQVLRVESRDHLASVADRVAGPGALGLQEIIPGGDDQIYSLGSYLDAGSLPLAVTTNRKLRQHPRIFGTGRFAESVWVEEVAEAGLRLLAELRFHGVSHTEFKLDSRDGRYKLMEVNARHWLFHSLARASGVDLSLVAYRDALGTPFLAPHQTDGRKWVLGLRDTIDSASEIWHGELSPVAWATSLRGTRAEGILSLTDPLPGAVDTWKTLRRIARGRHGGMGEQYQV
jgi:predicted ATP-grasp superfamily ATP-dependent carboligase